MFIRNLMFPLNGLSFVLCATPIFSLMQQFIATLAPPLPRPPSDELIEQLLHKTGNQTCLSVSVLSPNLFFLFFFWPAGLPHGFDDVRGGSLRGERAPHLQREHPGDKGHRGIPQTGGAEVPAGRPRWVNGDPEEAREKKEQLLRLRIFSICLWNVGVITCFPKVRSSACHSSALRQTLCMQHTQWWFSPQTLHILPALCRTFCLQAAWHLFTPFLGLFVHLYANYAPFFFFFLTPACSSQGCFRGASTTCK